MSRLSRSAGLVLAAPTLAAVRPAVAAPPVSDSADASVYSGGTFDGLND